MGDVVAGGSAEQTGPDGLLVGRRPVHGPDSSLDDVQLDVSVGSREHPSFVIVFF